MQHEKQWDLDIGILHFRIAYAIMPVGNKGYSCSIVSDNKKTRRCARPSGFSIPIFGVGRLNPTGWLPVIYRRPTI